MILLLKIVLNNLLGCLDTEFSWIAIVCHLWVFHFLADLHGYQKVFYFQGIQTMCGQRQSYNQPLFVNQTM